MILPISVIIPTMNRPESLDRTLRYMASGSDVPRQVIIIDQSQTEEKRQGNIQVANKYKSVFESVIAEYQQVPSLTKARNYGYTFATEEIIVFSDDDVDVRVDTFANVVKLMDNKTSMLGGLQEGEEIYELSCLSFILGMGSYRKRNKGHVARSFYGQFPAKCEERTPSEWAMGFFFVVRKSLLDKWNIRFDEKLKSYAYAEDLDFTHAYYKRSCAEGLYCYMSNKLMVKHNISKEYRIPQRNATFMSILHRYYLAHKHNMPLCEIHNLLCNIGIFFGRIMHHEPATDVWDAQIFYFKNRRDVVNGCFHNESWTK